MDTTSICSLMIEPWQEHYHLLHNASKTTGELVAFGHTDHITDCL